MAEYFHNILLRLSHVQLEHLWHGHLFFSYFQWEKKIEFCFLSLVKYTTISGMARKDTFYSVKTFNHFEWFSNEKIYRLIKIYHWRNSFNFPLFICLTDGQFIDVYGKGILCNRQKKAEQLPIVIRNKIDLTLKLHGWEKNVTWHNHKR